MVLQRFLICDHILASYSTYRTCFRGKASIFTDAYERPQSHTLFYVGTLEAEIMREWAEPAAHTVVASEVDPVPQYPAHQGPKEFHDIGMQTQGITSSGTMFRDDFPQNDGTTHNKIVSTSIPGTC